MALHGAISVFLSSTCYDLVDLRPQLGQLLNQNGFIVRMSEDVNSAFYVDPTDDSITSCLNNVESSDVVVCIIDRRYGGILQNGPLSGLSATHSEVRHARAINPPKPIFFFVRHAAYQEYEHMRKNGWEFNTSWVEPNSGKSLNPRRENWFKFVEEISTYPKHQNWSNWCDQFNTSVDLASLVIKRLFDAFPKQTSVLALQPDRVVRLAFTFRGNHQAGQIRGWFQNVGVGPALNIIHGFRKDDEFNREHFNGGLAVGMKLSETDHGTLYHTDNGTGNHARHLFCKYQNTHGDWFRVEVPVVWKHGLPETSGPDKFFVGNNNVNDLDWVQVS